jgi:hypothetical protein
MRMCEVFQMWFLPNTYTSKIIKTWEYSVFIWKVFFGSVMGAIETHSVSALSVMSL